MRIRFRVLLVISLFALAAVLPAWAQTPPQLPVIVVVDADGTISYARQGEWAVEQPVLPGTILRLTDRLYPEDSSLEVVCPNLTRLYFGAYDLADNETISCASGGTPVLGDIGTHYLVAQRGQDDVVLFAPRATVVRSPTIPFEWAVVDGATGYRLDVRRGAATVWASEPLAATDVTRNGRALAELTVNGLEEGAPYTVYVCVQPGGACHTDGDVPFYFLPVPQYAEVEERLKAGLGEETPQARYALAVALSQPVLETVAGQPIGVYGEAIALLERIRLDQGDSALARSAELNNFLGELYKRVRLPRRAAAAFRSAVDCTATTVDCAQPGTYPAAIAALGLATVTGEMGLYEEALGQLRAVMTDTAFLKQLEELCRELGDACLELSPCVEMDTECATWAANL